MAAYALCGKFSAMPDDREKLVEILSDAAELMKQAEGCFMYVVYEDAEDAGGVWVTEIWDSQEAHDNSLKLPGVGALIASARPIITGMPHRFPLIPIHGKGYNAN